MYRLLSPAPLLSASRTGTFIFLCLTIFLSGCVFHNSQDSNNALVNTNIVSPVTAISEDPELLLVDAEPDQCLTQELEALRQTGPWNIIDASEPVQLEGSITYDFPVVTNKQVEMYLNLFQNRQKKYFSRWLARSGRYLPMIQAELKAAGLPQDLVYLAMIESGFNERAYSRARAVGLWQFIRSTGKIYNLRVDGYVDERRNAGKSTQSAIAFLTDLYDEFGDWYLAVAAYNAGPGKIRRGLKKYNEKNFWGLAQHRYLKLETKRYVPKLIAAIIIAKEPEKYGFTDINYHAPLAYDTLDVGPGLSLEAIAMISQSPVKELKKLNRELRTGRTPLNKKTYTVLIPKGSLKTAQQNLPRLHTVVSTGYKTHIVRKNETMARICRRYDINMATLRKINSLQGNSIAVGSSLQIPYRTIHYQILPKGDKNKLAAYQNSLVLHKIQPGETISIIAGSYNVPPEMIVAWNELTNIHKIRAGQQLALYINSGSPAPPPSENKKTKSITPAAVDNEPDEIVVLTEQKKWLIKDTAQDIFSWYEVRNGDSLWTISRKFNISTSEIKRWNNLKSNLIHPGTRLKMKKV